MKQFIKNALQTFLVLFTDVLTLPKICDFDSKKNARKHFGSLFHIQCFSSLLLVMSKQIAKNLREQNWVALITPNEARGKKG